MAGHVLISICDAWVQSSALKQKQNVLSEIRGEFTVRKSGHRTENKFKKGALRN